ncbi:hypothetical protein HNP24_003166 [Chryseobacterium sediminis]|uniref:DUF4062 domain-containing protein n=1 Tax=Chryseobacterium sediminis TaxID=1679494 RepID=A0ABR6Q2I5_9FLAO|nr:DUF4062 domain-containing protein [Chryseobacterium sediminis]MBB6332174.1 hypothetical protein [Chryseobacterium sediminis]
MKEKKLQVFVSSTFTDLIEERQAAVEAILSSGNIPAGMELFTAADESQMTIIKRWIDESDVYMLILGGRYGSIEAVSGKSYTQLEYEYAVEQNKPLFAVVLSENFIDKKVSEVGKSVLESENNKELGEFKKLVMSKMIKHCDDSKDIKIAIHETLSDFSYRKDLIGWIRGDNAVNSNLLADQIARLTKENNDLKNSKNQNLESKYAGLNYEELKTLLKNTPTTNQKSCENLFELIKISGEELSNAIKIPSHVLTDFDKLIIFKVVKSLDSTIYKSYTFTEDGHKFYLRSLLDKEELS